MTGTKIPAEEVTFSRIKERSLNYIEFFRSLLEELRKSSPFALRNMSPMGVSWHRVIGVPEPGAQAGALLFIFARKKQFRVELYIDTGDQAKNKRLFDEFYRHQAQIEAEMGAPLSWERMDEKHASRIALYRPGSIINKDDHEELRNWAADVMVKFHRTLNARAIEALRSLQ